MGRKRFEDRWPDPNHEEKLKNFLNHELGHMAEQQAFDDQITSQLSIYEKKESVRWEQDGYGEQWRGVKLGTRAITDLKKNETGYLTPGNILINPSGQAYLKPDARICSEQNVVYSVPVYHTGDFDLVVDLRDLGDDRMKTVNESIGLIKEDWFDGHSALILWGRHIQGEPNYDLSGKEGKLVEEFKSTINFRSSDEVTRVRAAVRRVFRRYGGQDLHEEALEHVLTQADIPKEAWPYFGQALKENNMTDVIDYLWESYEA